jgi:hypothetical protein
METHLINISRLCKTHGQQDLADVFAMEACKVVATTNNKLLQDFCQACGADKFTTRVKKRKQNKNQMVITMTCEKCGKKKTSTLNKPLRNKKQRPIVTQPTTTTRPAESFNAKRNLQVSKSLIDAPLAKRPQTLLEMAEAQAKQKRKTIEIPAKKTSSLAMISNALMMGAQT